MFLATLFIAACICGAFSGVLLAWTAVSRRLGYNEPSWFYRAGITSSTTAIILLVIGFIADLANALFT